MESSPLTQQRRPETFEPKVLHLYLKLFGVRRQYTEVLEADKRTLGQNEEDVVLSDGFWRELFLLKPERKRLAQILEALTPDDVLQIQLCCADSASLDESDVPADANQNLLQKSCHSCQNCFLSQQWQCTRSMSNCGRR